MANNNTVEGEWDFKNRLVVSLETIAEGLGKFVESQTDKDLESVIADRNFLVRLNNGFQREIVAFQKALSKILNNPMLTTFDKLGELRKLEASTKQKVAELMSELPV